MRSKEFDATAVRRCFAITPPHRFRGQQIEEIEGKGGVPKAVIKGNKASSVVCAPNAVQSMCCAGQNTQYVCMRSTTAVNDHSRTKTCGLTSVVHTSQRVYLESRAKKKKNVLRWRFIQAQNSGLSVMSAFLWHLNRQHFLVYAAAAED